MTADYRTGAPVVYGGTLGYIVAPARLYREDGFDVIEAEPNGDPRQVVRKHWIPARSLAAAVLDGNVCSKPFPMCPCPLVHVRPRTLETLRARIERMDAAARRTDGTGAEA